MLETPEFDTPEEPLPILSERRRLKSSLVLIAVWAIVTLLHVVPLTRWAVSGLAAGMAVYAARLVLVSPVTPPQPLTVSPANPDEESFPVVSIVVPAKNEGSVLPTLLQSLQNLDYPANRYEVWAIDDGSTDNTPLQLERWQTQMPQLQVYRRPLGSSGGKSAALNEVLPQTRGEIVGVFDADAVVPADLLRRSLPLFQQHERIAAVQARKAIANRDTNIWTRGQSAEMAFDSYLQQQRQAVGGLGELRGNGQLVRRAALERAGGWNEATITDDLDLTFRLHLSGDDVAYLANPAVQEEGVTNWGSLWHQRSRWAEGGYQRYLDYWPGIVTNHLGTAKTLDLVLFFLMQYLLPLASIPDTLLTLFYSHQPALWPLGGLCLLVAATGIAKGLQRTQQLQGLALLRTTALGVAYMLHWVPVMATTTLRMCIRPKQLKWVKTLHIGTPYDASPIEQPNQ